jgi:large subunit ribosomal protein L47
MSSLTKLFSTTAIRADLMELFDDKDNWKESKVKHGRPWKIEELRLKSNTDLHKLWYVLHKERNMLLTMEKIYKDKFVAFPSPERIAKVDESMLNVHEVVQERNIAFNLLETGETKFNLPYKRYNSFGYIQRYREREYLVPWWMNKTWKLKYHYKRLPFWSKFYNSINRVKLRQDRNKKRRSVEYSIGKSIEQMPELKDQTEFLRSYYEKKHDYKPPQPYHELIRKPSPSQLPSKMGERMNKNPSNKFYDEEF